MIAPVTLIKCGDVFASQGGGFRTTWQVSDAESLFTLLPQMNDPIDAAVEIANQQRIAIALIIQNHVQARLPGAIKILNA